MTYTATPTRRHAIRRAAAAVVQLCGRPVARHGSGIAGDITGCITYAAVREVTCRNSHIVNDIEGHCDRQAWAAVFVLEHLTAQRVDRASGGEPSAGGQAIAGEIDPLDIACEECGAEPGEECRPLCIAAWQHCHEIPALTNTALTNTALTNTALTNTAHWPGAKAWLAIWHGVFNPGIGPPATA